jgi:hypothetical protein
LLLLGHHGQVSIKGKLELPFFFLFLVFFLMGASGCHCQVSVEGEIWLPPPFSFFGFYFVVSLGVGGHHCQVLAQFGSPLFFGCFWVQLGTIIKY